MANGTATACKTALPGAADVVLLSNTMVVPLTVVAMTSVRESTSLVVATPPETDAVYVLTQKCSRISTARKLDAAPGPGCWVVLVWLVYTTKRSAMAVSRYSCWLPKARVALAGARLICAPSSTPKTCGEADTLRLQLSVPPTR